MSGQASTAGQARNRCLTPAAVFEFGKPGIRRAGESQLPAATDDRAAAGWFATPGQEGDIVGPFCAELKLARPKRLTTPGSKSGQHAGVLRQTNSRPRIALLQSLVGVNQDHVRMITGMPSTHLSRCPGPHTHARAAYGAGRPHSRSHSASLSVTDPGPGSRVPSRRYARSGVLEV